MTTRRKLLVLLQTRPGSTVNQLSDHMGISGVGVRRHLDALVAEGTVETLTHTVVPGGGAGGIGRPAIRWRLSAAGLELLPRRYDSLAVELMDEIEFLEPGVVEAAFRGRSEKLAGEYRAALANCNGVIERAAGLA
ncbi:MAG: helix-turn-helix transcriptional regulator, partial [Pseudonocardiaceae bacterium]